MTLHVRTFSRLVQSIAFAFEHACCVNVCGAQTRNDRLHGPPRDCSAGGFLQSRGGPYPLSWASSSTHSTHATRNVRTQVQSTVRTMATFVDLGDGRHHVSHSSSRSSSETQLKEYLKEFARKPKLVVLDIGERPIANLTLSSLESLESRLYTSLNT